MKRTFIAVTTGTGGILVKAVEEIRHDLKNESVKWVDLNQAHITLAFLGDTSEESIREVSEMLSERCSNFGKIEFTVKGIGVFRSISDPNVIWAGIEETGRLGELSGVIREGLDKLGLITEERQFRPHLTLARLRMVKNKGMLKSLIGRYEDVVFQKAVISEVIFFESILQQTGPLYLPIKRIRLKGQDRER